MRMIFVGYHNPDLDNLDQYHSHLFTCPQCRQATSLTGYDIHALYSIAGRYGADQVWEVSDKRTPYFTHGWYGECCNCSQPLYSLTGG